MKTKGALMWGLDEPWSVEELEIGDPRHGEVKIQMEAAGMCRSDLHLATGAIPMGGFPIMGGHEGAGVIVEVGEGVTRLAVGDHVVLSFIPSCGHCPSCEAGMRNLCDLGMMLLGGASVSDGSFRIQARGQNVYAISLLGTFSPYMVVHESSVVKVDPTVPFELAYLVGCGVTTGFGAATHSANVQPGDDVTIVGVGGVGISALQGAIVAGARQTFVVDPVQWKRDKAKAFGATHAFASIEEATPAIADLTHGLMSHKVIVTVDEVSGSQIEGWMSITAKRGVCVLTALAPFTESHADLNLSMLTLMQKSLVGCLFGGSNPKHAIPQLISMYKHGRLNLADMVTREYRLEDINQGFQHMRDGKNIRGVIRYTDADR